MPFLQPLFYLFLALSILVLVHEWGHFFVARRLGVRVLKFSIGFGPELIGFTRGDTRWAFSAIPFGGYVKFAGENPEEEESGPPAKDEFLEQGLAKRSAIVLAGPVMNYVLAVLLFAVVLWVAGDPVPPTTRIGEVVEESRAADVGIRAGDVIREVNGTPVATWNEFTTELHRIGADEDFSFTVERGGESLRLGGHSEEGFGAGSLLGVVYHREPVLGFVKRGGAAWDAGLRTGDRLLTVAGQPVDTWSAFAEVVQDGPGEEVAVTFERDGHPLETTLVPVAREVAGPEGRETIGDVAAQPRVETRSLGPAAALAGGWQETWNLTRQVLGFLPKIPVLVFQGLLRMVTGEGPGDEGLGGPVRMAEMFGEAARWGMVAFLGMMANISAQLAIFNLLPVPVLDGGHLALYAVEVVTRRPPSLRVRIVLQQIGFALLILLMLSVTVMDVGRVLG
jgi:regulator of sigma E protease